MSALRKANRIVLTWHFQKVACSFKNVRLKKKKKPTNQIEVVLPDKNLNSKLKTD